MNRIVKSIRRSSERGIVITEYPSLTSAELDERIRAYERKYGMPYSRYNRQFDCATALPWATGDLMDWENLVNEKEYRRKAPKDRGKKS